MNKYIKFSSPFIFLLSLILILIFKTVPSGKLWKDYSVICVPVNTPDSTVMAAIQKSGIKNQISLSGQYLPVALSENSIEISMLRLNYTSSQYAYLNKRSAMFYDKSQAYRLYYIPGIYASETSNLIKMLEKQGIECIKDSSADYPWLLPVIAVLLAVMLFLFVKNKLPFAVSTIIPLVFLYSNPFYPVATATCLTLLCCFFTANVWRRRGAISTLLRRHSGPAMLAIAFICAFSSSIGSGFLYILVLAGTAAAFISCHLVEDFFRNRKPFVPVYIRSAKRISLFAGKPVICLGVVSGAVLLFIILIFITSSTSIQKSTAKLLFPGKARTTEEALPQFEDYFQWNWAVKTTPYISLNDMDAADAQTVSFSNYVEDENTGIITEEKITLQYDDSFRKEVYDNIDTLPFDSVEKLMKSEGSDFCGGYTATSSYQITLFGIIMCFICLFILLFIYISIIIRKGINK